MSATVDFRGLENTLVSPTKVEPLHHIVIRLTLYILHEGRGKPARISC